MFPLPAMTESLNVIVGDSVIAAPVAPDVGVKLDRVGAVVSIVMLSDADAAEVLLLESA